MTRAFALGLVLTGATCMSFVGLILRLIEAADGFQILFYRSLALAAMVLVVGCIRRGNGPLDVLRKFDRWDVLIGFMLCFAFSFYVYALLNTSIASALFILSSSPIFAALLAWLVFGERPGPITYLALLLAIAGVGTMVWDGLGTGGTLGNLCALFSAFCFASMLVTIRSLGREDSTGGTFLGGVFAAVMNAAVALAIGSGLVISTWDLGLSLFMGAFTIGLGIAFVTWAASHLPSSEVSILVLLESVLGPVWVWVFLGETASVPVIAGGGIVLLAVVLQTLYAGKRGSAVVRADRNQSA